MASSDNRPVIRSEIIRSPALFLKEIEVVEDTGSRGRRFSGTHVKALVMPLLSWLARHAPIPFTLAPLRLAAGVMRLLYRWRNNPLRLSCEAVCRVAERAGRRHLPEQIYRQFLANILAMAGNYCRLYRHGIDSVLDDVILTPQATEMMLNLIRDHGGAVLAVPHNLGSAFSSLKLNRAFPLLLVAKNSPTIARTRAALDFFERMEVSILMVRGGSPFELSRALFAALKSGKVVAATLDNLDLAENRVVVSMFGQPVGLAPWAAKIAARHQIPIVPSYFQCHGRQLRVVFGEPIVTDDVQTAVQHYAEFFARSILEDPASWAYLADRKWHRLLRQAAAG